MYKSFGKRFLDLLISIIGLPVFALIYLIFAPLIKITDRGPVFYIAERLGKNGNVFKMYKFRTMKVDAPDIRNNDGSTYNDSNDPRLTSIGSFMRKMSIDETAQILNVLKGDMSIIGPRPFMTTHYTGYENLDVKGKKRLEVKPGITGYSQAYFRNSIGQQEKIDNDVYYANNISFSLDFKIFFHTIKSVIESENIYSEN